MEFVNTQTTAEGWVAQSDFIKARAVYWETSTHGSWSAGWWKHHLATRPYSESDYLAVPEHIRKHIPVTPPVKPLATHTWTYHPPDPDEPHPDVDL